MGDPRRRLGMAVNAARGAAWARRALGTARRQLRSGGVEAIVKPPPRLGAGAGHGVLWVLRRQPATCLERALVLREWLACEGRYHDVIIGVAGSGAAFQAHAWVEGVEAGESTYAELHRLRHPAAG